MKNDTLLKEIDFCIRDVCIVLWKKGYETMYSCSGISYDHIEKLNNVGNGYIVIRFTRIKDIFLFLKLKLKFKDKIILSRRGDDQVLAFDFHIFAIKEFAELKYGNISKLSVSEINQVDLYQLRVWEEFLKSI